MPELPINLNPYQGLKPVELLDELNGTRVKRDRYHLKLQQTKGIQPMQGQRRNSQRGFCMTG